MKFFSKSLGKKSAHINLPNISYEHKYVFVHIPKNAGTSVYKKLGLESSKHKTVDEYIKMMGIFEYNKLLSFAFVRNPFSRFVSLYNYAKMEVSHYHNNINPKKAIYGGHMDFELLKDKSIGEAALLLAQGKLKHNPPHVQWNPQVFWLKDEIGELNIKYIGRVEDLVLHMQNLSKLLNIESFGKNIPNINASSKKKRKL